jgi:squalene-hopene/tetraprenyl-beta-curcumene cyclase
MRLWVCRAAGVAVVGLAVLAARAAPEAEPFPKPAPDSPDEPKARELSLVRCAEFLDNMSVNWIRQHKCATCHTTVPYLMARPALAHGRAVGMDFVRKFFEEQVAGWGGEGPRNKPRNDSEVVATAAALAVNDARTTGKLHPMTRKALDLMWARQAGGGAWNWTKCSWPPMEHDDYYGAVLAAVGAGHAPDGYAETEQAKAGLEKLRRYFRKTAPPTLHHKAWLLWASQKVDDLMPAAEREQTVKELLALQRPDGGWSLPSLGDWKGFDGRANNKGAPGDGYGTGLVVFVLRQAGVPAEREEMHRGVAWLKANQRESGRWFTQSLNTDRTHFISHAGTAFAVLALTACGEK